jgi:hypothetical protein
MVRTSLEVQISICQMNNALHCETEYAETPKKQLITFLNMAGTVKLIK